MLTSLILTLRPLASAVIEPSHGGWAYAMALELLLRVDPRLAQQVHDTAGQKPLTVSQLQGPFTRSGPGLALDPEQAYWWRLTGLDEAVSDALLQVDAASLGALRLGNAVLQPEAATTVPDEHEWAAQTTCEDLFQWHFEGNERPDHRVSLRFFSPTTFRGGEVELPFPTPRLVFRNYWEQWNRFAPVHLGSDLGDLFEEMVLLSRWRGETKRVDAGERRTVGFVGEFEYRSRLRDGLWPRVVNLLADYALFCGTGWNTTMGLGQTRRTD
jgi:CRISPR-associated endoribonuclease Cas6